MANFLPAVILPGYLADQADYLPLVRNLADLNIHATVVSLRWWEWLPTVGGRSVAPILLRLDQTIKAVRAKYQCDRLNLIAHSAGGWIARIYLGDVPYYGQSWSGRSQVACLVSLGTPQVSLEPWASKNLDFVNLNYPGAFHAELSYVCVAGKAVLGEKKWSKWLAYSSYELTIGDGNSWGDGIIPIAAAHLKDAHNLVLAGAQHSPRAGLWYGSVPLLPEWVKYLASY